MTHDLICERKIADGNSTSSRSGMLFVQRVIDMGSTIIAIEVQAE